MAIVEVLPLVIFTYLQKILKDIPLPVNVQGTFFHPDLIFNVIFGREIQSERGRMLLISFLLFLWYWANYLTFSSCHKLILGSD